MPTMPWNNLVRFGKSLLVAKGVGEEDAEWLADLAAVSHVFGAPTHGLGVLGYYHKAIGSRVDASADPIVVRDKGASVLIDANGGLAQFAIRLGKRHAVEGARRYGVCMAAIRNAGWCAALGPYLIDLAEQGFLAQAWVQHSTCADCPPHGGIDGKFSTNPIGFAFPIPGGVSVSDFSTSSFSMGKVRMMKMAGEKAPEPLFLSPRGEWSCDPHTMDEGGTMFHAGGPHYGYKGYALSLWCEAMSVLAGGNANDPDRPGKQAINLVVIDPEAFAGEQHFRREMERFVPHVKDTRLREGYDEVRLPGENGYHRIARARREGLEVEDWVLDDLRKIAAEAELDAGLLEAR
ncbi:MAG: Ldh family oxidoreductase [Phycisphaerae bacterium]